jgi:hypothetical protein
LGHIPSSDTIPLGLSSRPFVFLTQTGINSIVGVAGTTTFPANAGPTRPSPINVGAAGALVTINSGGASMSISTPGGITYAVYSKTF